MHTAPGSFFTSVALESANAGVLLCIETGAMCEAHKYNERVTHCLCVVREDENTPFTVLSPCSVCQERLRYWGEDVRVGVTTDDGSLRFVPLRELQPYHWMRAYPPETLERYGEPNEQRRPKNTKTSFYCAAGAVKSTGKAAPACTEAAFGFYAIFI